MAEQAVVEIQAPETPAETPSMQPTHEEIVALAKILWEERGCPEGSPEVDWFEAERRLREK